MAHQEGGAPVRLIRVPGADGPWPIPIYISCRGPRAQALAREAGDGADDRDLLSRRARRSYGRASGTRFRCVVHAVGAVREDDEPWDSERLKAAVGPVVAVAFHQFAEQPWRLEGLDPELRASAEAYLDRIDRDLETARRHQELHRGHLVEVVTMPIASRPRRSTSARFSVTGTAAKLAGRVHGLAADGVTELALQPGGDVADELRRLAAAFVSAGLLRSPDGA